MELKSMSSSELLDNYWHLVSRANSGNHEALAEIVLAVYERNIAVDIDEKTGKFSNVETNPTEEQNKKSRDCIGQNILKQNINQIKDYAKFRNKDNLIACYELSKNSVLNHDDKKFFEDLSNKDKIFKKGIDLYLGNDDVLIDKEEAEKYFQYIVDNSTPDKNDDTYIKSLYMLNYINKENKEKCGEINLKVKELGITNQNLRKKVVALHNSLMELEGVKITKKII